MSVTYKNKVYFVNGEKIISFKGFRSTIKVKVPSGKKVVISDLKKLEKSYNKNLDNKKGFMLDYKPTDNGMYVKSGKLL